MDFPFFEADVTLQAIERVGLDPLGQFVLIEANYHDHNGGCQVYPMALTIQAAQVLQLALGRALAERVFLIDKN